MDQSQFWAAIDASRQKANGDLDAQLDALREQLDLLSAEEVVQFQEFFDDYFSRAYR